MPRSASHAVRAFRVALKPGGVLGVEQYRGALECERFEAIGESDRITLKFIRRSPCQNSP